MNRLIDFKINFEKAISILFEGSSHSDYTLLKFKLTPIDELDKTLSSQGDYLIGRQWIRKLPDFNKIYSFDESINLLIIVNFFPLWIEMEKIEENPLVIELRFSKRFRKFRELHNQELGYPPFKIIK